MTNQTGNLGRKKKIVFSLILLFIPVLIISAVYVAYAGYRTKGLVQYSSWLVGRAQSTFGQAYFGKLPTPYCFVS
jgi:hypothetical protein